MEAPEAAVRARPIPWKELMKGRMEYADLVSIR